uniref:(northern house mosquito) hypothetical protein n=1 Tax=Culex pipiens TaxID=7175 RepID=A0A8D8DMD9_CULPI
MADAALVRVSLRTQKRCWNMSRRRTTMIGMMFRCFSAPFATVASRTVKVFISISKASAVRELTSVVQRIVRLRPISVRQSVSTWNPDCTVIKLVSPQDTSSKNLLRNSSAACAIVTRYFQAGKNWSSTARSLMRRNARLTITSAKTQTPTTFVTCASVSFRQRKRTNATPVPSSIARSCARRAARDFRLANS